MTMRQTHVNGPVPNGWRWVRLGDVCTKPEYGAAATAIEHKPVLPRYVRISDITDDGRLRGDDIRSADPANVEGFELSEGDFLFARSGSVGRTYRYRSKDGACVFAGYLIRFRPLSEHLDISYLEHWTHSPAYHRWIESTARRGAQTNINATEYSSLPILLPPLAEQRSIATVLDSIDDAIERTEEVIATTEALRDSLLHELLTRGVPGWHIEWKEVSGIGTIPAEWEVARLGDVCEPPQYGAGAAARPYDPNLPRYVRITDLTDDGRLSLHDPRSADPIQVAGYELRDGDLLFARSGATVGKTYLHREGDGPCMYAGYLIRFRPQPDLILPEFLELFTHSRPYYRWVASMFRAGAQPNINAAEYASMPVPLPLLGEQRSISLALTALESSIASDRRALESCQALKSSVADALL